MVTPMVNKAFLEKMGIDTAEVELRKRLMGFRRKDAQVLTEAAGYIDPVISEIVDEFFGILSDRSEISRFLIGDTTLGTLESKMGNYLRGLFSGHYDQEYVLERLKIGLLHQHKGVEPKLFVSAMKNLKEILRRHISQRIPDKRLGLAAWNAVDSLLTFDTLFVLDAYFYSLVTEIDDARGQLEEYARSLEEKVASRTRELEELSRRDSLTGLYNHRAFNEFLRRDLALSIRNDLPLSLVYIDVDDFKDVNDELGHYQGDQVLKHLGWVLAAVTRESDIPCRYGGDEFCVILPNTSESQARAYCERVIKQFSSTYPKVTLSFGIAQSGPDEHLDMDTLIRRADELMYSAKKSGGDRIATSSL